MKMTEQKSIQLLKLLDEHNIGYTLALEGIVFFNQQEHEKAKQLVKTNGLEL
jgi:hypothetical protein